MIRNYFLINLLLITIIGFLGIEFYKVMDHEIEIPSIHNIQKSVENKKDEGVKRRGDEKSNFTAFDVIAKKDLFRPSRSAPLAKQRKTEKPLPKNTPKLFGTIILNNLKTAILQDPDTKTSKNYQINDSIGGYVISEIFENKVVLMFNDEKVEIKLRDNKGIKSNKRSRRATSRTPQVKKRTSRRVPRTTKSRRKPTTPKQPTTPEELEHLLEQMDRIN